MPAYELRISDWSSDVCSSDLSRFPIPDSWPSNDQHPFRQDPDTRLRRAVHPADRAARARAWRVLRDLGLGQRPGRDRRLQRQEIGRGAGRVRECRYGEISVGFGSLKKKKKNMRGNNINIT